MITKYFIAFGIEKQNINEKIIEENETLSTNDVDIQKKFDFPDFNSMFSIRNLKGTFLTLYGDKFNCCGGNLSVYQLKNKKYFLLSKNDGDKLSKFKIRQLYIIKRNILKYDEQIEEYYKNYFQKAKFDVYLELKKLQQEKEILEQEKFDLKQSIKKLKEENEKITKKGEENFKKSEDFYDVIVDIKSIKGIKEGWDIKWNKKGKKLYEKCRNNKCIRLGVIGNRNKGKSFLLSKISNTELISGAHIQTEGLSIKYHDSKSKPLILLDSASL